MSTRSPQPRVVMQTELGDIVLEIDLENAPITASNFLRYVDEKRFVGSTFYRVVRMDNQPIKDVKIEVIQGGIGVEDSPLRLAPIQHETSAETGILHENGTISMARAEVGSASSEIFICIGNQPELDYMGKRNPDGQGFAAFGHVIKGMDVVLKIQEQAADGQILITPIKITKIRRRIFS
ncbi:MAG: peptidylprolyl isomerase [Candidatus Marinimicrobia bacterium]|nr:peptidylprolyl isomerase [Candidatus Neomarinimicrobiota bacterium]MBT3631342.1 peptidylprolyl isomerase [Candidatus Neomarinimicrobiota bacterium]MBT3825182.1 peptidylprolyl isomerase [Candidatus Neomarinimicrobiota bacterium]MBT4129368.1 peptidylprolyl isomerase [Candidatus Neomarinimicrobiota bacterium]MBT4296472.1 peptidylprolyl isomerase [Candidatus Neomarinimicrobiota bacterium]